MHQDGSQYLTWVILFTSPSTMSLKMISLCSSSENVFKDTTLYENLLGSKSEKFL